MAHDITAITDIAQIHHLLGLEPPTNPLVTVLEEPRFTRPIPEINTPVPSELFAVSLKSGSECTLSYGRRRYDFQQGSLLFLSPGQSFITSRGNSGDGDSEFSGWTLVFHPDIIRNSAQNADLEGYTFFRYESDEALHLSKGERTRLTGIIQAIKGELSKDIDGHSNGIIVTYIDLLLKYSQRFYSRQFITRSHENRDILIRFEAYLKNYLDSRKEGDPLLTVRACAGEMGYSPHYLSDLLKKETGKSAQEHISFQIMKRAKDLLRTTDEPVNAIALSLGFEYPQHFSKFFKDRIGRAPTLYRREFTGK